MLCFRVHRIKAGTVLARTTPLSGDRYRYLLQRDREIRMDLVPRLKRLGIDFNPDRPVRPKVQGLYTPNGHPFDHPALEEIDLSLHHDLEIAWVDGKDVRPYTAVRPADPAEVLA